MSKYRTKLGPGAIGKRVDKALLELVVNRDPEEAALHACIAVAATSKREHRGEKDGVAYKTFLKDNKELVWAVGTCGAFRVKGEIYLHLPAVMMDKKGGNRKLNVPLEQVIYKLLRCYLIHEGELPGGVRFTSMQSPGWKLEIRDPLILPWQLLLGLIFAVVGSKKNSYERTKGDWKFADVPLNDLWGRKDEVERLVETRRSRKKE